MIADLTYLKKHLRIEDNDENELLTSYASAAQDVILKFINQTEDELYDEYGQIPPAIKNAVCMMAGSMYRDREATTTMGISINPVMAAMVKPYKKIVR